MDIFMRIPREDSDLVTDFLDKNKDSVARLIKGGTLLEFAKIANLDIGEQIFDIPNEFLEEKELDFFIKCFDGRSENISWLSFGLNGEKMIPFHVFGDSNIADAVYFVRDGLHQVSFSLDETFRISKVILERNGNQVILRITRVWSGYLGEQIPYSLCMIEPMIISASNLHKERIIKKKAFIINEVFNSYDSDGDGRLSI